MLQGVLVPLFVGMMSFTSYLQNWPIDTSESQPCLLFPLFVGRNNDKMLHNLFITEIELVGTRDCCELEFELVMLHQWPILSKSIKKHHNLVSCLFFSYKQ